MSGDSENVYNSIDPATVPQRTLYTGAKMPAVGLGTFGSDHVTAAIGVSAAVTVATLRPSMFLHPLTSASSATPAVTCDRRVHDGCHVDVTAWRV